MPVSCFVIIFKCIFVVSIYTVVLLLLSALAQLSFDANVWTRDIDSNPSPFPMSVILSYTLPFTARYFSSSTPTISTTPANTRNIVGHAYCLPGCACARKLLPTSSLPPVTHAISRSSYTESTSGESTPSVIPVRLPTDMERRRSIIVTFDGLDVGLRM